MRVLRNRRRGACEIACAARNGVQQSQVGSDPMPNSLSQPASRTDAMKSKDEVSPISQ